MSYPTHLAGVDAKIIRADEHYCAIDAAISKYLETCRNTMALPVTVNRGKETIRLTFEPIIDPDIAISIMIGDCVHNLSCVLDHLWKRLGGTGHFPMFGGIQVDGNWRTERTKFLTGIAPEAHAIIDSLQPCSAGKDAPRHPFSMLNELSNIDRHQAVHLTKPLSRGTTFDFADPNTGDSDSISIRPPVVFRYDTEVIISDVPIERVRPGMQVKTRGDLFVSFNETGPWADAPVQDILSLITRFLRERVIVPLMPYTS